MMLEEPRLIAGGPSFGWVVDDWEFVLFDVRCRCGWFLAKAQPITVSTGMGFGIGAVEGECKRHGHVTAETWDIIDREALS